MGYTNSSAKSSTKYLNVVNGIIEEIISNEKKTFPHISLPGALEQGVYVNSTLGSHTKEEFLMDFIMVSPSGGVVTA